MECYEQITLLIYDAIGDVNAMLKPDQALERSPDTVLVGESAKLDSLGFVNFVAALEENLQRIFEKDISLVDVMLFGEQNEWTVASLAKRIRELVDSGAQDQRRAQVSAPI